MSDEIGGARAVRSDACKVRDAHQRHEKQAEEEHEAARGDAPCHDTDEQQYRTDKANGDARCVAFSRPDIVEPMRLKEHRHRHYNKSGGSGRRAVRAAFVIENNEGWILPSVP